MLAMAESSVTDIFFYLLLLTVADFIPFHEKEDVEVLKNGASGAVRQETIELPNVDIPVGKETLPTPSLVVSTKYLHLHLPLVNLN